MEPIGVDEINLLKEQNEELRNAYNAILEQCKKEQAENATYKANADAVQKFITQNEQLKTHIDGLEKKNAELKAENERLKQIPEQYNAYIRGREQQLDAANAKIEKLIHETVILKKVASSAQNAAIHINQQADKYFGCLQEIKTIAEEYHHNKPRLLCNMDKFIEQILQKIIETEEEDETKNT